MKRIKELSQSKLINHYTKSLIKIDVNTSIFEASQIMKDENIHHLPVTNETGVSIVGILSESDLKVVTNIHLAEKLCARDLMSSPVVSTSEDSDLSFVVQQMLKNHVHSIIIKSKNGQSSGIFTVTDALHALHDLLGEDLPDASPGSIILY